MGSLKNNPYGDIIKRRWLDEINAIQFDKEMAMRFIERIDKIRPLYGEDLQFAFYKNETLIDEMTKIKELYPGNSQLESKLQEFLKMNEDIRKELAIEQKNKITIKINPDRIWK